MTNKELPGQLRQLHLPGFVGAYVGQSQVAVQESWTYEQYLSSLCALESGQREVRRKEKLLAAARLPGEKTLANFARPRLTRPVERQFAALLSGEFLARAENVLVFGNPGGGKTHLLCALGHELVQQGHSVYFSSCVLLVPRLLTAKRELWLEKELKRLDKAAALIIDDLG